MAGFYFMHRGWQDHPVFRGEAYSRRDAFVWLIEQAAFKPTRVHMPQGEIVLDRGQLGHSLRFMAKAWKWDEAKVRRFLSSLRKAKIIDAHTDAGQTITTICNYNKYQAQQSDADAATDADATQRCRGNDAKNNNEKNEKNSLLCASASEDLPELVQQCCHAAGLTVPDPMKDWNKHNALVSLVQGWIDAGADPDAIRKTITERAAAAQSPVKSLRWFDGAVRDAITARAAGQSDVDPHAWAMAQSILKQKREAAA